MRTRMPSPHCHPHTNDAPGGNPDSNTLISDMTTVICLDDYHCLDRNGRKEKNVTALAPEAQNFELMYQQVKALKEGKAVDKPIYNHVSGLLDPAEKIDAPQVRARLARPPARSRARAPVHGRWRAQGGTHACIHALSVLEHPPCQSCPHTHGRLTCSCPAHARLPDCAVTPRPFPHPADPGH